ncbi:MAG: hypothetical protein PVH61_44105 [Candidatus Aminicenantes bacterium]|jgi:hypothetical protein
MITRKILKKGVLLTLFFFLCFTLTSHFTFAKDEDVLLKARMLVKKGDFDSAIKELYEVIEKLKVIASQKRNLAEAYYLLARVYKIVQMQSECKYHLKMALKIYPNFTIEEPDPELTEMMKQIKDELKKEALEKEKQKKEEQEKLETEEKKPGKGRVLEKPGEKKPKKKKKFPVLWVVAGTAVVAVVVALLLKKKTETSILTVINGDWRVRVYTGQGTINYTLVFLGNQTEGNVYVAGESDDRGDYQVTGNQVGFTLYDRTFDNVGTHWKYTFEGRFDDENNMSGSYIWENYVDGIVDDQETGSWDARRL